MARSKHAPRARETDEEASAPASEGLWDRFKPDDDVVAVPLIERLNAIDNSILGPPKLPRPVSKRRKAFALLVLLVGLVGIATWYPKGLPLLVGELIAMAIFLRLATGAWPFQRRLGPPREQ